MNFSVLAWLPSPPALEISQDEVHVWRAVLEQPGETMRRLSTFLSHEELEKANRFYFPKDRNGFIVSHAFLRDVISRYIQVDPWNLEFRVNPHGKPALAAAFQEFDIQFNLSHSNEYALVAVMRGQAVGVDVELIRPEFGGADIARRFFSPSEVHALLSISPENQGDAFFRCWTRKEAFIKAIGRGLALPLDEFDVSVLPEEPAGLLSTRFDPQEAARWSMFQVDPAPGYSGSVAAKGKSVVLVLWSWIPPQ
jgi:4'-phosphopantetheinyl transferase